MGGATGYRGEQVVVIFLEAGDDEAARVVEGSLRAHGFDVYTAGPGDQPAVELDYENARYLVIVVSGQPVARVNGGPAPPGGRTGPAFKVLLFPGVPKSPPTELNVDIEWDAEGEWLNVLDAALEYVDRCDVNR